MFQGRHAIGPDSLKERLCATALNLTEEACYERLFRHVLDRTTEPDIHYNRTR